MAGTLGVARSNLIERLDKVTQARGPYRKAEDAGLLLPIRAIIDERPTYGYRRVGALLNRHLRSAGKPTVNMKRVLRIMQNHGLTLERHTARRPDHTHDGVIIALHSNIRWCSDHLELHARNREVVRILFVLDACDREIIAWWAVANAGISGEMGRDLMVAAVEGKIQGVTVIRRIKSRRTWTIGTIVRLGESRPFWMNRTRRVIVVMSEPRLLCTCVVARSLAGPEALFSSFGIKLAMIRR